MLPLPSSGQCHYTVAFSPDGRWLAAGGSGSAADVWDLHAPQNPAVRLDGLHEPVVRVQFTPEGLLVVSGPQSHREYDTRAWSGGVVPTAGPFVAGGATTNHTTDYLELRRPGAQRATHRVPLAPRPHRVS